MPQMYPTQWLMLTNMMILLLLMLMSLMKYPFDNNSGPMTKNMKSKTWKW